MTTRILLMVAAALLLASSAQAQTITSWTLNIYAGLEGTSPPIKTAVIPASAVACNIDPATPQPDKSARWDDTVNAGRDCQWVDTAFFTLAVGNYRGGLSATNAGGPGPESALVPFSVSAPPVLPPAAPTGLGIKASAP